MQTQSFASIPCSPHQELYNSIDKTFDQIESVYNTSISSMAENVRRVKSAITRKKQKTLEIQLSKQEKDLL